MRRAEAAGQAIARTAAAAARRGGKLGAMARFAFREVKLGVSNALKSHWKGWSCFFASILVSQKGLLSTIMGELGLSDWGVGRHVGAVL